MKQRVIIMVGGTSEQPDRSQFLYKLFARFWEPTDIFEFVDYPASIVIANRTPRADITENAKKSRTMALEELQRIFNRYTVLDSDNFEIILMGYSLGAWVVSDLLETADKFKIPRQLRVAITVGNPRRASDTGASGIAGQHSPYPGYIDHVEVSNYWDIVSNTPERSPLKLLPAIESFVTELTTKDARQTFRNFVMVVMGGINPLSKRDTTLLKKYADGTGHGSEYKQNWCWDHVARVLKR